MDLTEKYLNEMKMDQLNSKGTILLQYDGDETTRPEHFTIRAGRSEVLLKRKEAEALLRSLKRLL